MGAAAQLSRRRGPKPLLALLALSALLAVAVSLVLFAPDYFEDNRYNLGVARRSALPGSSHLLETSLSHLFFEAYPMVRAEDWHRGLSVLVLSLWARFAGASETWMRLPHVFWFLAWVGLQALFLRKARPESSQPAMLAGCVAFFLLYEDHAGILRRAFTDDLPAAVFALAGMFLHLRDDESTPRSAACMGALLGVAALCKDAFLLMGVVGGELILFTWWSGGHRRSPIAALLAYGAAFALLVSPRFLWSFVDHGAFVKNPIQHWMVAHFYGTAYLDAEHYPYFLFGKTPYLSRVEMAGGPWEAFFLTLDRPLRETFDVLWSFAFLWIGFALVWVLSRHLGVARSRFDTRILAAFLCTLVTFALFFGVGFGESLQIRYWILPLTLGVVWIIAWFAALLPRAKERFGTAATIVASAMAALLLPLLIDSAFYRTASEGRWLASPEAPLSHEAMEALHERAAGGGAAVLEIPAAIYYWSEHPEDLVVAFPSRLYRVIGEEPSSRFVRQYDIRYALVPNGGIGNDTLRRIGFAARMGNDREVLLERPLHGAE